MSEETPFLSDGEYRSHEKQGILNGRKPARHYSLLTVLVLSVVAAISIGVIIVQAVIIGRPDLYGSCRQPLSGLDMDVDSMYGPSKWSLVPEDHDMTALDEHWNKINTYVGVIALPKSAGFGGSLPFPWDETKNVYNINAFHNLHCLQCIYQNVRELQQGMNSNMSFMHTVHCLDVLRSDTICIADETPASFELAKVERKGIAPPRKCRDWNKMLDWAKENSACFKRYPHSDPRWNTRDAFTHCPPGSPYWEEVDEYKLTKKEEWGDPVE